MPDTYRESDGPAEAGASSEASEQAQERFRENLKKSQAARQQIQKDERKARAYDDTLAVLLRTLIQTTGSSTLIVLLSELIEKDLPSDFLLSILVLQFPEIKSHIENTESASTEMTFIQGSVPSIYSSQEQKMIQEWLHNIQINAFKDAERVIETMIETSTWQIRASLVSLAAHVLKHALKDNGNDVHLSDLRDFLQKYFTTLQEKLQSNIS